MIFTYKIAVLIPCFNEQVAISKVVQNFKSVIPECEVYVFDNNSSDQTREIAARAGAIVRTELLRGKGNVIRRMFADIEADIYVLVDGDDTYDPASAPIMIKTLLENRLDMVNGKRITVSQAAYRRGHQFGNWFLTFLVALIFGDKFKDILSGYRVFSRRFVKSFPALSKGFEIETELTVHALELRMPTIEIDTNYRDRPLGSSSKLRTLRDGWRILIMIFFLIKEEKPLQLFGVLSFIFLIISIILIFPVIITFIETGFVPRLPTAILAMGLMIISLISLSIGLILDSITLGRREAKRMNYLRIPCI